MQSLKVFLTERLAAAAEEIFAAVEKTITEYKEEICLAKDLEISRLRMQLKILRSDTRVDRCSPAVHLQQHQSAAAMPAVEAPEPEHCDEDGGPSLEPEHPEASQVKKEQQRGHRDFWMSHEEEQLDSLEPDIKDFISPPSRLKSSFHDPASLVFHHYHGNSEESREKPYSCSVCEKRFSNCSHLAAHIRTHTGERPYRCEICRKTFITTSALNRHQTIHTEGKHYVCNYCGKSFKWMESLGRHVRSVHKRDNMSV
ncbi:zinc finger and BTB domain-containing protein 49-like [Thalassophryne amazonica]|uniref:zinc finger and BTB domain-containing protein 49-like n=1 Tax=Thalassophryne amazonica TaxID=390379 RepID=UPI0014713065|nr:zinc finger and BTB domain-containing protein 49-like [Thalassophryne amazonica]